MADEPIWRRYLRFLGEDAGADVDDELGFHLEMREADLRKSGLGAVEARERARAEFGERGRIETELREIGERRSRRAGRAIRWESIARDIGFAVRALGRRWGFATVTIGTLATGIAGATAIFSVVDGVLLRPLQIDEPDQLVQLWQVNDGGQSSFSFPNFFDTRQAFQSASAILAYRNLVSPVANGSSLARINIAEVSAGLPEVYRVGPERGRWLTEEEMASGAPVAVVDERYWRQELGARPELGDATIRIGDRVVTVVGVMPAGFNLPSGARLWTPRDPSRMEGRTGHNWQVAARLRPGVGLEAAQAELTDIAERLKSVHGEATWMEDGEVVPLLEQMVGRSRSALLLLFGASIFLLLIACANVVNLLLAHVTSRRVEIGIRSALGATRTRVAQQLLVESLVIGVAACAIGVLLAGLGLRLLPLLDTGQIPRLDEVRLDGRALFFAVAVALTAAVGITLATAWRQTSGVGIPGLRGEASGHTVGGGGRLRTTLIAVQVAVSILLLIGAGLLARSFLSLVSIDPGYVTSDRVVVDALFPLSEDESTLRSQAADAAAIADALGQIPGAGEVGWSGNFPLSGFGGNGQFLEQERPDEIQTIQDYMQASQTHRTGYAEYRIADSGYFRAMGIPLLRGRLFEETDGPDALPAAVISESLARTQWPDEEPIGKLIQYANMDMDIRPYRIVGVVGDVRDFSFDREPRPTFYGNARQRFTMAGGTQFFVVGGDFSQVSGAARRTGEEIAPEVPIGVRRIEEIFSDAFASRRFSLVMLSLFAGLALLLAVSGIYGMMSYALSQRRREFGIRAALGATRARIATSVVLGSLAVVGAGAIAGLVGAFWGSRILEAMVYGVSTRDPVTFAVAPALLILVGALATLYPALRATRSSPSHVLRAE